VLLHHLEGGLVGSASVLGKRMQKVLCQHITALRPVGTGTPVDPQLSSIISHMVDMND